MVGEPQLGLFEEPKRDIWQWWVDDENPYGLRWYQLEGKQAVEDSWAAGNRKVLLVWATGCGKAQPVHSKILTPGGWTTMGMLQPGDMVMGSDGTPYPVTAVYDRGTLEVFSVTFSDGTSTECCADHLWAVRTKSQKARGQGYTVLPTKLLMGDLLDGSGAAKWFAPVVKPVKHPHVSLPMSPWLLGVLLGDGCLRQQVLFSTADSYIVRRVQEESGLPVVKSRPNSKDYDYYIRQGITGRPGGPITNTLKQLGVWGCLAHEKRIPGQYLMADERSRLELLRGLMDTDGYARPSGGAEFCVSSQGLAQDVADLVRSLGGTTAVRERKTARRPAFRLRVNTPHNPFSLPRKRDRYKCDVRATRVRSIASIERSGVAHCKCIAVGSPDNLYVTDDYVVTHNTQGFVAVAGDTDGRVLIIAHRDELIEQAAKRIDQMLDERVGIEKAEHRSWGQRIVVGSLMSMNKKSRLKRFPPDYFKLIIVDEAHHAITSSYRIILNHFTGARVLGVTATPKRADKKALGREFDDVAHIFDIGTAIDQGYLVPLDDCHEIKLDDLDLDDVAKTKGDLNVVQLDKKMLAVADGVVDDLVKNCQGRRGIVFWPGVASAEYAAQRQNELEPGTAFVISGKTDQDERRMLISKFRKGELRWFHNCQVATEGFDAPDVDVVGIARVTLSESLLAQMIGRGTRTSPDAKIDEVPGEDGAEERRRRIANSSKPRLQIREYSGNAGKYADALARPVDVLGGSYTDAEVKLAKKKSKRGDGGNPAALLEAARAELKARAAEMAKTVKTVTKSFNPFEVFHMKPSRQEPTDPALRYGFKPPTDKQLFVLKKAGIPASELDGMSRHEASRLIGNIILRREKGLATYTQLRSLQMYGVSAVNMRARTAADLLRYFNKLGNSAPDPARVAEISRR